MPDKQMTNKTNESISKEEKPYILSNKAVNYVLGLIEIFLLLRFVFKLAGANPAAGVVRFVYGITDVLMAPFLFIFPTSTTGEIRFEWSVLVAMVMYALVVYAIFGVLDIFRTADVEKA